jgi:hypothetical protein
MSTLSATPVTLYDLLSGEEDLTDLLAIVPGTEDEPAIYDTFAADNAPMPYVIYQHQGGGPRLINPSPIEGNLWTVKAYSNQSAAEAAEIFDAFDVLLDKQKLEITGLSNYWVAREQNFKLATTAPNKQMIWMVGGIYRIETDE